MTHKDQALETRAVHAGRTIDPSTRAIVQPIHLSTTFEREPDGSYPGGFSYAKFGNPNRDWLETSVTELEGAICSIAFSAGLGDIAGVLSALAPGDRVIVSNDVFQGTARVLNDQFKRWGIEMDVADTCDLSSIERAIRPRTRLIWIDTPSNPLLRVADIAKISALARSKAIWVAVDSTFATVVLQRPIGLGADVVVYAATKFIAGHSDVVCGLAAFRERGVLYERARAFQVNLGVTPSPFDCWLVHRGLKTLPLRIKAQSAAALRIAEFLQTNDAVETVFYPGLPQCEGYQIAQTQMAGGFGGIVSFTVKGGNAAAMRVAAGVRLFTRASSLGGVESLIEHRASSPVQTRGQGTGFQIPDNLLRLSIGLENVEDLIRDLANALSTSQSIDVE